MNDFLKILLLLVLVNAKALRLESNAVKVETQRNWRESKQVVEHVV